VTVKPKLADQIYDRMRRMVEGGEWSTGTRIPPEMELARLYGVSRPIVREALVRLRADGVFGSRQGAGTFVVAESGVGAGGYRPVESVADLIKVFEFRLAVECDIAAMAALRCSSGDIDALRAANAAIKGRSTEDGFGEADFQFHLSLARCAKNEMCEATLQMLKPQITLGMRLIGAFAQQADTTRSVSVLNEHDEIIETVLKREPAAAYRAMHQHILNSRRRILGFDIADGFSILPDG
jgi:GntR family transcriptional regulator, transcriptional repressor for pyruvate dehydrogenase complex